ncbi:MAG: SDR family NAD(P)-dependent oxidoreductase [Chitinophagales bacterium]|nr:SDR family NAD(P)-dependent oxidoreductase [Chitinophagales bacterium]
MKKEWTIVTGGGSGIGLKLVKKLLKEGRHVGLILRNAARKSELLDAEPGLSRYEKLDYFFADLSVQIEIKAVAQEIINRWPKVDVLFNNAGVLLEKPAFSAQGNEMHYEVNTLAPFLLASHLRPALAKSETPLIVNTSTDGIHYIRKLDIPELINPKKFRKLFGPYMYSKLAQYLIMKDSTEDNGQSKVKYLFVSPGGNKTKLSTGKGMPGWMKLYVKLIYKSPSYGADLLWEAAFNEDISFNSGSYIQKSKAIKIPLTLDPIKKLDLLKGVNI